MKKLLYSLLISLYALSLQAGLNYPGYPAKPSYPVTPPIETGLPATIDDVVTALNNLQKDSDGLIIAIRYLTRGRAPGVDVNANKKHALANLVELKNIVAFALWYDDAGKNIEESEHNQKTIEGQAGFMSHYQQRGKIYDMVKAIKKNYAEAQSLVK